MLKHRALVLGPMLPEKSVTAIFLRTHEVDGGLTCSQRLVTLTGESPTPFRTKVRTTQAHKLSLIHI